MHISKSPDLIENFDFLYILSRIGGQIMKSDNFQKVIATLSGDFCRVPDIREFVMLAIFVLLGLLGNYFNVELFFGVNFIFGSIAALLAVRMSGALWGTLAAVAIGSYTFILWQHPYAMLIFGLEAFVTACFLHWKKDYLILGVVWYWVLIGMPLVALFYTYGLGLPDTSMKLIMLKQAVNGLFNAVVARVIIQLIPKGKWSELFFRNAHISRWRFQAAMKVILAIFVLIPLLTVMVVTNRAWLDEIHSEVELRAAEKAQNLQSHIYAMIRTYSVVMGSVITSEIEAQESGTGIPADKRARGIIPGMKHLEIMNKDGQILYAYPSRNHEVPDFDRMMAQAVVDGFAFSDIHADRIVKDNHFNIVIPLSQTSLFASVSLTPELFDHELARLPYNEKIYIGIRDSKGNTVAEKSGYLVLSDFVTEKDPNILFPQVRNAAVERWIKSYWKHTVPFSPNSGWTITIMVPLRNHIIALQQNHVRQLSVIFAISVIALSLSVWVSRLLARPIVQLSEVTVKLTECTSSNVAWPVSSVSEIFVLVCQFKTLLEAVNKKQKELEQMTLELEHRVQDRTKELKAALDETEQAKERIDGILKSVVDGIIVTSLENRVTLMNPAARAWLNCRPGDMLGSCKDIGILEETLRDKIEKVAEKDTANYEFDFEVPAEKKHPKIMRARTSVIFGKNGSPAGIVTAFHDVTQEREVDRMKTEFLSTAAHELRTPLTSIRGFSEILLTRDNLKDEEKTKFLTYINQQAVKLGSIVNDLLDLSRIESGKGFALQLGDHPVEDVIREVSLYYQGVCAKHEIAAELPDADTVLLIDRDKIGQVLHNLISNAVKFSPNGGVIRVHAQVSDKYYEVCVTDQGIGMMPDQVERVFDKFYRADSSNSAPEGTGLGMAIVKHIVESHGGKTRVESIYGEGTTVCFTIAIRKSSIPASADQKSFCELIN